MGVNISFENFLLMLNLDLSPYIIDSLCYKLTKPTLFLKREMKENRTNVYAIKVAPLWEVNIDTQYILDLYVVASYYASYLTKIDESIMSEFQTIIKKCEDENIDANLRIKKLGNDFFNAQQMSAQLATYIILSLPLYHASKSFSFLNTSPQPKCAFVLKSTNF